MVEAIVVIPARYKSSRFPGKPLALITGRPMILHVAEKAALAVGRENVYVATDDDRIRLTVENAGFSAVMTSESEITGTDRVAAALGQLPETDIVVNLQGDEPLVDPVDIANLITAFKSSQDVVINGYCEISATQAQDISIPKVVMNEHGHLLYMSRAPIPASKENSLNSENFYRQVCIYVFSPAQLKKYRNFGRKSILERREDIEILRFFELGIAIKMIETSASSLAVDFPEHIVAVESEITKADKSG